MTTKEGEGKSKGNSGFPSGRDNQKCKGKSNYKG